MTTIYIIYVPNSPTFKFGVTKNFSERQKAYRTNHAVFSSHCFPCENPYEVEKDLKEYLASRHSLLCHMGTSRPSECARVGVNLEHYKAALEFLLDKIFETPGQVDRNPVDSVEVLIEGDVTKIRRICHNKEIYVCGSNALRIFFGERCSKNLSAFRRSHNISGITFNKTLYINKEELEYYLSLSRSEKVTKILSKHRGYIMNKLFV